MKVRATLAQSVHWIWKLPRVPLTAIDCRSDESREYWDVSGNPRQRVLGRAEHQHFETELGPGSGALVTAASVWPMTAVVKL